MKKPALLKQHLLTRTPWLNEDPSRLAIYVENGSVKATGAGASFSHELDYQLIITVLGYPLGPEKIIVPTLEWVKTNQPDLRDNPDWQQNGFTFEVEVLDSNAVDLTLKIRLTERITVEDKDPEAHTTDARFHIQTEDEPQRGDLLNMDWAYTAANTG